MTRIETNLMMVLWCSTMRWNHYFMGWGGWPLESLDGFLLICFIRSHIHAWNIQARGWMAKKRFGLAILRSGGMWKSHHGFWFFIINESLFLLVFLWVIWWIICGLYGCDFMDISTILYQLFICFMTTAMYGSHHVITYIWMNNVYMT